MKPLFLGSHPAMDFLNTTLTPRGETIELIGDGAAYLAWLAAAGLLDSASAAASKRQFTKEALDEAAAEAREFRAWTADRIARWSAAPGSTSAKDLRRLNAVLERGKLYGEVAPGKDGLGLVERCRLDSAEDLIALVAVPVARLLTGERPELVKRCAGSACTLWFLDRTKAHGRLFCSAAACGNRAKVAAFRERQRG
jgi:predicted RNA-binding Zn ribbon-like protein